MKIVMVENYNVSYAEKLIPACDIPNRFPWHPRKLQEQAT